MNYAESINSFIEVLEQMCEEERQLAQEHSQADLKREEILHKIELTTFNASGGYKIAKELQRIQKERREVKNRLAEIQCFKAIIGGPHGGIIGLRSHLTKAVERMAKAGWNK